MEKRCGETPSRSRVRLRARRRPRQSRGTAYQVEDARALYEPFGEYRLEPTGEYTDRGYTGHLGNNSGSNDIGLIYMNARYYVPNTNRMLTPDTIVPDPANPQSFNRYSYVLNSPLNFTDPSGHIPCEQMPIECQQRTYHLDNKTYYYDDWNVGRIDDINAYDDHPWAATYLQHIENGELTVPEGMTANQYVAQLVAEDIVKTLTRDPGSERAIAGMMTGAALVDLFYQAMMASDVTSAQVYAYAHAEGDLLDDINNYIKPPSGTVDDWFNNPTRPPGPDWEWRGPADRGNWFRESTHESLRPALNDTDIHGPHWDYKDSNSNWWRIYPDGTRELK